MRRIMISLWAVLLWMCLPASAASDNHVVIITIDGCAAYFLTDPQAPLPTLRKLAAEGATAEGMRVSNPSITWPNHSTLITGVRPAKHSVFFNGVLVRGGPGVPVTIDPKRDKADLIAVPTIFDVAHAAGMRTAGINWPCTRNAPNLDDNFPDVPDMIEHTTPRLREELVGNEGLKELANDPAFKVPSAAAKDQLWTEAACHVIRQRKPNLLLIHMLLTDGLHHKYGPQTPAGYAGLAVADAQVREVLRALDDAGIRKNTTVFIVADHGFATAAKLMQPNLLLKKAGLLKADLLKVVSARVQAVSEGGTAMVYCTDPATAIQDRATAQELFRGKEGIADIIQPDRFEQFGFPQPDKNRQMADMVLVAKPGYGFANSTSGEDFVIPIVPGGPVNLGYHGYISTNPKMNAIFIAAGRGIKPGVKLPVIENINIAPTAAALLGIELPSTDGKAISEILANQ